MQVLCLSVISVVLVNNPTPHSAASSGSDTETPPRLGAGAGGCWRTEDTTEVVTKSVPVFWGLQLEPDTLSTLSPGHRLETFPLTFEIKRNGPNLTERCHQHKGINSSNDCEGVNWCQPYFSPEKCQGLSLTGLVTGSAGSMEVRSGPAGGQTADLATPCTPGEPLAQLHHKQKVQKLLHIQLKYYS